jgi:ubiquinone biosynthesis protein
VLNPHWITTRLVERRSAPIIRPVQRPARFRALAISLVLIGHFARLFWWWVRRRHDPVPRALALRALLERFGGLWVKVGQLLGMRRDVFSDEFCDVLAELQDRATGFAFSHTRAVIEAELGAPPEHFFSEIDEIPFAAASIGQLHRARLRSSGALVAVKIRRPYINETMLADIGLIRWFIRLLIRLRVAPTFRWDDFYVELERTLSEELDYRFEATYLRQMRRNLRRHKVYVPKVYLACSRQSVLTMEFIQGALMSDLLRLRHKEPERVQAWLRENRIDTRRLGRRLFNSLARQVFEENLFHGDLHPGNIILLRDSRVALIDMGSVGWLEGEFLRRYLQLQRAMADQEYAKVADLFLLLAPSLPPIDLEPAKRDLVRFLRTWALRAQSAQIPYAERSVGYAYGEMGRIFMRYRIGATWTFLRINRAQITLDASLQALYPELDYFEANRRYARAAERRAKKNALKNGGIARRLAEAATTAVGVLQGASERNLFELEWLRKRARVLELGPTKAAMFGVLVFNTLLVGALGGFTWLTLLYLHQAEADPFLSPEMRAHLASMPRLPPEAWWAVAFAVVVVLWQVVRMRRRLAQPDITLADGRNR